MLVIGEKINISTKVIREAMMRREPKVVQDLALAQVKSGAHMLDLNIGPAEDEGAELMDWMVRIVQDVVQVPLSLDTTNPEAIEAGLKAHNNEYGRPLINSTSAEEERINTFMPLAAKYKAQIIGLTLSGSALPQDANERCAVAVDILSKAAECGVPMEDIYLDPVTLPVSVDQKQPMELVKAVKMMQDLNDPPMKSVVGLSNVSNSSPEHLRSLINRTFLIMLMTNGLSAAIVDPLDTELMNCVKTFDIIVGNILYAHSYLET